MKLRLLLKGPGRLLGAVPEKTLESGHIIIGRSPDADWMIPDPERVVSKAHCRIDATERGFILTDTSTNGVRINGVPVARGLPSLLSDGDTILLGDAILGVEMVKPAPAPVPQIQIPQDFAAAVAAPAVVIPATAVAEIAPAQVFPDGPFGLPDPAPESGELPAAAIAAEPQEAAAGETLLQDWWDPKAVSGKPEPSSLPEGVQRDAAIASPFPAPEQASSSSPDDGMQAFSALAGDVDVKTLLQAVEKAAQVLSGEERERFEERLRDILRQGIMHKI